MIYIFDLKRFFRDDELDVIEDKTKRGLLEIINIMKLKSQVRSGFLWVNSNIFLKDYISRGISECKMRKTLDELVQEKILYMDGNQKIKKINSEYLYKYQLKGENDDEI